MTEETPATFVREDVQGARVRPRNSLSAAFRSRSIEGEDLHIVSAAFRVVLARRENRAATGSDERERDERVEPGGIREEKG